LDPLFLEYQRVYEYANRYWTFENITSQYEADHLGFSM
jgi:hypothetical protein